jgi:hypothetical protein
MLASDGARAFLLTYHLICYAVLLKCYSSHFLSPSRDRSNCSIQSSGYCASYSSSDYVYPAFTSLLKGPLRSGTRQRRTEDSGFSFSSRHHSGSVRILASKLTITSTIGLGQFTVPMAKWRGRLPERTIAMCLQNNRRTSLAYIGQHSYLGAMSWSDFLMYTSSITPSTSVGSDAGRRMHHKPRTLTIQRS